MWVTELKAIDPNDGELKTWMGDYVEAPTWELAQEWCDKNKGYLTVVGELVVEILCDENFKPDWNNMIDYEKISNN